MATEASSRENGKDQADSAFDDLIREIINDPGSSSDSNGRDMVTVAALFDEIFGSGRKKPRGGAIERLLLTEAFASELADALAPALADRIAPRVMKAMDQLAAEHGTPKKAAAAASGRSGG
jgi:hypothetical protein